MQKKIPLLEIPGPSTSMYGEPLIRDNGEGGIILIFDQRTLEGENKRVKITFTYNRAMQWRAEGHCTVWHIEGCYDTVVRVENSEWIKSIINDVPDWYEQWKKDFILNHYMIYLDSFGCFEVIGDEVDMEITKLDRA